MLKYTVNALLCMVLFALTLFSTANLITPNFFVIATKLIENFASNFFDLVQNSFPHLF